MKRQPPFCAHLTDIWKGLKVTKSKKTPCLAVLGTGSDVGKSIIVTALCRSLANQDVKVAPFKAQNMSNNSGVTPEGLEMGRAQIVQAEAARLPPQVDMNPILLKPTSEIGSQVVLLGKVAADHTARDYHKKKEHLFATAAAALQRLQADHELIILEGAGSCAEVNLMAHDIVNLRMAEYAQAPVVLVADIHRGGVFAQIIGTLECLSPGQRDLIKGFIINRFRGDIGLFDGGVRWIEQKTGKKILGVLPWYDHIHIEPEDSVVIENPRKVFLGNRNVPAIAVIRLPHISNFTDFDPLAALQGVEVYFLEKVQDLSPFRAVILPGSKNTRFDLDWLKSSGWTAELTSYTSRGGHVLGICGGYQMMGNCVHDPGGLEGRPGSTDGLKLLPVETYLKAPKTTTRTRFAWDDVGGSGYEIHMGHSRRLGGAPLLRVFERNSASCEDEDGCLSPDNRMMGTYIHGLFDNPGITRLWLASIGLDAVETRDIEGFDARDRQYDLLAEHFEKYVDIESIIAMAKVKMRRGE
ncbi:MAG: cobyric acid synthase [Desulfobacterales bacterium]|nr:MAG: cobyric acid synthase [Desulfobacterales bacterium]